LRVLRTRLRANDTVPQAESATDVDQRVSAR